MWAHKDSVTVAKPRLTASQFTLAKLPDPASAVHKRTSPPAFESLCKQT